MDDEEEKRNAQLIEGYDNEKEWSKRKSSRKAMWNLKREEFTPGAIEGECPDYQRYPIPLTIYSVSHRTSYLYKKVGKH